MSEHLFQSIRDELTEWSQPLIVDQINHFYFTRLSRQPALARELAIEHYRVWRLVLRDQPDAAREMRAHLADTAASAGIEPGVLDDVDRAVLDELMDVVVSRFRRTPYIARSYGITLLDTATSLAQARHQARA